MTKVVLELPPDEALALAQLTKRIGYDDCERLADRHDGGAETEAMLRSIDKVRHALCEAGFAPR
jgi:hypothetical protein